MKNKLKGFSLIEISIVLVIVGLLLGSMMAPLGTQIESSRRNETKQQIAEAIEALYGYSLTFGHLPCPDTTNDGSENRTAGICDRRYGNLPWATLSVSPQDSWGQALLYRVTMAFADTSPELVCPAASPLVSFSFCTAGDIIINNKAGGGSLAVANNIPAIVLSRGKNWGVAVPSVDEAENSNTNAIFVKKIYSSVAGAEFDDIVSWVVPAILVSRMVKAGRLP